MKAKSEGMALFEYDQAELRAVRVLNKSEENCTCPPFSHIDSDRQCPLNHAQKVKGWN